MAIALLRFRAIILLIIVFLIAFPVHSEAKPLYAQTVIDAFYLERDGEPLWVEGKRISESGKELFAVLQHSWMHGLNPDLYYVPEISAILSEIDGSNQEQALRLELLLTSGYIRYIQDLSGMRVSAYDLDLRQKDWLQRIPAQQALKQLPEDLNNISVFLKDKGPQTATYKRLKKELVKLVQDNVESGLGNALLRFERSIYPGKSDEYIPELRERLGIQEKYAENRYVYDSDLVKAVKVFQSENGLTPDGIIGKQTLFALNHRKSDKIQQLILNMERLRWVADEKPDRFIVVNIPSARLWAIDNGSISFTMPVIVGRKDRPTLSFVTKINGVRFNPSWSVPPTVKKEDILPHMQKNPAYLADKGMELRDGYGKDSLSLDPQSIDWHNISEAELHSLNMVQIPGNHNPLGHIRILMPNEHNIYLHDTNEKSLFYNSDRAQSSGCIRMKYPEKVAAFALKNRTGWIPEQMDEILETGETKDIYVQNDVAVYLLYYTVWVNDKDQIVYGQDIYDWDKLLYHHLEKLDGIPIIMDNSGVLSVSVN